MAPEMIEKLESTSKVDMWALGVIFYQFFTNELPFIAATPYLLQKLILEKDPEPLPSSVPLFIKDIIASLLDKNPDKRPDTKELLFKDMIIPYVHKIIS